MGQFRWQGNVTTSPTDKVPIGSTLRGTYDFDSQGAGSDASLFQWYYKASNI
ncbi:hypothetical protein SSYM_2196 [Serratia symbiotica str. Tucson]|uniref:Uncharacterized protein n=2 Tax=Serratia symbiotica TaxID=138074 RepID=E9CNY9_9GAMM|nr:hypothetical protein SSYM_2196 [Serratia symbiotica str. Tucson]BBI92583.1 uncharacterized protein SSYIS1_23720 [Serratia symbiotica]